MAISRTAKSSSSSSSSKNSKLCFVTVGATAGFNELIEAVLSDEFLQALQENGYTDLRVQYGKEGAAVFEDFEAKKSNQSLSVTGFDFKKEGLREEILSVKGHGGRGDKKSDSEGVLISHAGSGTILDALRIEVPIVVVPNSSLLDNHQVELAEELARQGYVIHGKLGELPAALREVETLRQKRKIWPPPVDRKLDPSGKGLMGVLDDEMGFVD